MNHVVPASYNPCNALTCHYDALKLTDNMYSSIARTAACAATNKSQISEAELCRNVHIYIYWANTNKKMY